MHTLKKLKNVPWTYAEHPFFSFSLPLACSAPFIDRMLTDIILHIFFWFLTQNIGGAWQSPRVAWSCVLNARWFHSIHANPTLRSQRKKENLIWYPHLVIWMYVCMLCINLGGQSWLPQSQAKIWRNGGEIWRYIYWKLCILRRALFFCLKKHQEQNCLIFTKWDRSFEIGTYLFNIRVNRDKRCSFV